MYCRKCGSRSKRRGVATVKADPRYTSNSVFDTFPWPQSPTKAQVVAVAEAARNLREVRRTLITEEGMGFRRMYRFLEGPGRNRLIDSHEKLNKAVRAAYGFPKSSNLLSALLVLNHQIHEAEEKGKAVQGPGLPPQYAKDERLFSTDCIQPLRI